MKVTSNRESLHGTSTDRRRHRYSAAPVSLPQASSFRAPARALSRGMRREHAFRTEVDLSPVTIAILNRYAKPPPSAPRTEAVFVRLSPERAFFDSGRTGTPLKTDYKLQLRFPFSSPSQPSPPSSPSPLTNAPVSALGPHTLNVAYKSSPLITSPYSAENDNDASKVTFPVSAARCATRQSPLPVLDTIDCRPEKKAFEPAGIYVLEGTPGGGVRIFRVRRPGLNEKTSLHWAGDCLESQVFRMGLEDNVKTFQGLNVKTDVNIRTVDTHKLTHNHLAPKVLGWVDDSGILLSEFEVFCSQCDHCKRYSSRRSMESSHLCPIKPGSSSAVPTATCSPSGTIEEDRPTTEPAESSRVAVLYERFHSGHGSPGITAEELQYLFVICSHCEKVMTRTTALGHVDSGDSDSDSDQFEPETDV